MGATAEQQGGELAALQAMAAKQSALAKRPKHVFTVPVELRAEAECDAVGIVALDLAEEIMAAESAQGAGRAAYAHELAKFSLRTLYKEGPDGKLLPLRQLSAGDASSDAWYGTVDPRVRGLVIAGYGAVHQVKDEVAVAFLESRRVVTD